MPNTMVYVVADNESSIPAAQTLAQRLELPYTSANSALPLTLHISGDTISLHLQEEKERSSILVDFLDGAMARRLRQASSNKELIKAIGLKHNKNPSILDGTAGLGRDATILAQLGYNITLIEHHPIIFTLLEDGIRRAQSHLPCIDNITLIHDDTCNYLRTLTTPPDIIYLDPMFPARNKSAKVKKDLRILQYLEHKNQDEHALLSLSRGTAKEKTVVKRPIHAPHLANHSPDYIIKGKVIRYDIYRNL